MKKAEATRFNILQKAFELIYEKGYQTTSIDDILVTTQVTKGAFYYHFKNKDEMGIAIINELLKPTLTNSFIEPLQNEENPIETIHNLIHHLLIDNDFLKVQHGCPGKYSWKGSIELGQWKMLNFLSLRECMEGELKIKADMDAITHEPP